MYDTQKPDVEELIHYGKKGMRWGQRNSSKPSAGEKLNNSKFGSVAKNRVAKYDQKQAVKAAKKKAKPSNDQIRAARARTDSRIREANKLADVINLSTPGGKSHTQALNKYQKLMNDGAADAKVAQNMTTGDKVATTLLLAYGGLVVTGAVARAASR